jgi:hypothetical protein
LLKENKQPKGENPPNPVTLTNASIFASHFPVFVFTRKNGGGGLLRFMGRFELMVVGGPTFFCFRFILLLAAGWK